MWSRNEKSGGAANAIEICRNADRTVRWDPMTLSGGVNGGGATWKQHTKR